MKRDTIKWRIFKYNIIVIIMLITLTAIIFNVAVHMYIEKDIVEQLDRVALNAEHTALQHGPDFFPRKPEPPHPDNPNKDSLPVDLQEDNDPYRYYFMLDRSLKEPFSLLNSDFILLDKNRKRITPIQENPSSTHVDLTKQVVDKLEELKNATEQSELRLNVSGTEYIAIVKPVSDKNSFGLGWIIIYSSVEKINQLQYAINFLLLLILIFSALITVIFSSRVSKKISEPFSHLNQYISNISERNFGNKVNVPVYDELREFVNNINVMSEKLETYDKAQKTFLQNVSHEFRTPLMSIQSYAEGIKYDVIDSDSAVPVILSEIKRMTHLVEDLLYLSRLDAIEENYNYMNLNFNELISKCIVSMNLLAEKSNICLLTDLPNETVGVYGDEEKLSRAITNIISNCIRYAHSTVSVELKIINNTRVQLRISDDGPGFKNNELPNIFDRFYKGSKGNFGLGLSISKNVIEKLNGIITAKNSDSGALFIIELYIDKSHVD
ncbi:MULTISPECIES: HAMP domain-containing sensor histidine kinase [unclassified Clostridium]|uniref:sensor histidine kinase n=1 Tax=unclassified Clostridium TaxID=2614128 RepID=UPI000297E001|nr:MULTISPECIES: HAMP domain-containing sensor histidine kinase [unclassified Clostridium]EKQ56451.1 MAG: signal transduction histidine kinase [Clostridium sp. Maddingley MBC34-26]